MLQRKITKQIEEFYKDNPKKALMIIGARQVGKSYIIEQFANDHYDSVIKMDFIENPDYIPLFEGAQGADEILLRLSALFGDRMIPGKTMIFFDEVQECKELITQIKYLVRTATIPISSAGPCSERFSRTSSPPRWDTWTSSRCTRSILRNLPGRTTSAQRSLTRSGFRSNRKSPWISLSTSA